MNRDGEAEQITETGDDEYGASPPDYFTGRSIVHAFGTTADPIEGRTYN